MEQTVMSSGVPNGHRYMEEEIDNLDHALIYLLQLGGIIRFIVIFKFDFHFDVISVNCAMNNVADNLK
jgi:hypothetical protein